MAEGKVKVQTHQLVLELRLTGLWERRCSPSWRVHVWPSPPPTPPHQLSLLPRPLAERQKGMQLLGAAGSSAQLESFRENLGEKMQKELHGCLSVQPAGCGRVNAARLLHRLIKLSRRCCLLRKRSADTLGWLLQIDSAGSISSFSYAAAKIGPDGGRLSRFGSYTCY